MYVDPTGESLLGAIIVTGAIVGGLLGAFSAATTGGNVLESAIEGCLTGALSSTCGILISNPIVAVGIAIAGGAAVDFGMQVSTQYVTKKQITLPTIDYGRVAKTGLQTGISTAIPQYGKGAQNAVDAFGTALIWAEGSALITCLDIAITNLAAASANQNTSISEKTNQRTSTNQYSVTFSGGRKLVM